MSIDACAGIVSRGDPDRFAAVMSAPVPVRAMLFPIYAFNVEVARAPWASAEAMICEMRLQWWYDVLGEIEAGAPARAHEVVTPLAQVAGDRGLPLAALKSLVSARRHDIYSDPFDTEAALSDYIEATAAGLMWAAARVLGADEASEAAVRDVGWAGGLASYLRAIPALEARGRRPLHDGRPEAVAALARLGLDRLRRGRAASPPRIAAPALRTAWRAEATLTRAARDPERVGKGDLDESPLSQRLSLLRRSIGGGW